MVMMMRKIRREKKRAVTCDIFSSALLEEPSWASFGPSAAVRP